MATEEGSLSLELETCPDCGARTMLVIADRIWCFNPEHPIEDWDLSQSQIAWTLRSEAHMARPYAITQLIRDVENLTPDHLDYWNVTRGPDART